MIELLKPVYNNAVQYCIALTKNEVEAKDLLQESLLKAITKFASLHDGTKSNHGFLKIITREFLCFTQEIIIGKKIFKHSPGRKYRISCSI